jgi:hypothetical protein
MDNQANQETGTETATADTIHATLTALEASGADQFDPVRFYFIRSMANRSLQQDSAVAALLVAKAHEALTDYEVRLSEQRENMPRQIEQPVDRTDTFSTLTELLHTVDKDGGGSSANGSQELKSVRYFRDALQRQHADKLVTDALIDAPQDAGPLNPQKLALRSLAIMRDISPAYLGHFVSYLDALFWLEKIDTLPPSK